MPPETNGDPPSSPDTTVVGANLVGTPMATPIPPNSNDLQIQNPQIKSAEHWKRERDRIRGSWMAERSQWDQIRGQMESQFAQTATQLQTAQEQVGTLTTERAQLQQSVEGLPTLQQRSLDADAFEQRIARLELVLQRGAPIIAQSKTDVKENEDGTKTSTITNPFLDLVLSSAATGDEFKTMLDQVVARLPATGTVPAPTPNPTDMTTTPPPAPAPAQDEIARLLTEREEAYQAGDRQRLSELNEEIHALRNPTEKA